MKSMATIFVAGILTAAAVFDEAAFATEADIKAKGKAVIDNKSYDYGRGLHEYFLMFPPEFAKDLLTLDGAKTVLDSGCGKGRFSEQYLRTNAPSNDWPRDLDVNTYKVIDQFVGRPTPKRAKMIALDRDIGRALPNFDGKLIALSGRFFEDVPNHEIGEVDRIVDLFGVFAYAPQSDAVLRKYLELLKPDGVIYIYLGFKGPVEGRQGFARGSTVITKEGKTLTLLEWLQRVPGLNVRLVESCGGKTKNLTDVCVTAVLSKKKGATIRVPGLELLSLDSSRAGPPLKQFRERM